MSEQFYYVGGVPDLCHICGSPINEDDIIVKDRNGEKVHIDCAKNKRKV